MSKELTPREGDIIFYTTPNGAVHIEVFFQNETFWLSQKKMAGLKAGILHADKTKSATLERYLK